MARRNWPAADPQIIICELIVKPASVLARGMRGYDVVVVVGAVIAFYCSRHNEQPVATHRNACHFLRVGLSELLATLWRSFGRSSGTTAPRRFSQIHPLACRSTTRATKTPLTKTATTTTPARAKFRPGNKCCKSFVACPRVASKNLRLLDAKLSSSFAKLNGFRSRI